MPIAVHYNRKRVNTSSASARTYTKLGKKEDSKSCGNKEKETTERKKEIVNFSKELSKFNLSFSCLTSTKPNQKEKELSLKIAKLIKNEPSVRSSFLTDKKLPIDFILQEFQVPKKFLRKHNQYLTALSLLYCGPYLKLKEYFLGEVEKCEEE